MKLEFLLLLSIFLLASCGDADATIDAAGIDVNNCVDIIEDNTSADGIYLLPFSPDEWATIIACRENEFAEIQEIENNLVGTWNLVGFEIAGFGTLPTGQVCGSVTFTPTDFVLDYRWDTDDSAYDGIDTTYMGQWSIEVIGAGMDYHLALSPNYVRALDMSHFCQTHIFGDNTPGDGLMHLYEKE